MEKHINVYNEICTIFVFLGGKNKSDEKCNENEK
jgi:hypothetical protein